MWTRPTKTRPTTPITPIPSPIPGARWASSTTPSTSAKRTWAPGACCGTKNTPARY
jgi:hypothetical protein